MDFIKNRLILFIFRRKDFMKGRNNRGIISPRHVLDERRRNIQRKKHRQHIMMVYGLSIIGLIAILYTVIILVSGIQSDAMETNQEHVLTTKATSDVMASKRDEIIEATTSTTTVESTVEEKEVGNINSTEESKETEVVKETQPVQQSIYNENVPMSKDLQEYLYQLCQERGLDYKKTLAIIHHESGFQANVVSETQDYGYFQINRVNHQELAEKTQTENNPLSPYVNLNWGTYLLSTLYQYWSNQGISGETLDEYVWSSYNKGIGGFQKTGYAYQYIEKTRESIQYIESLF